MFLIVKYYLRYPSFHKNLVTKFPTDGATFFGNSNVKLFYLVLEVTGPFNLQPAFKKSGYRKVILSFHANIFWFGKNQILFSEPITSPGNRAIESLNLAWFEQPKTIICTSFCTTPSIKSKQNACCIDNCTANCNIMSTQIDNAEKVIWSGLSDFHSTGLLQL